MMFLVSLLFVALGMFHARVVNPFRMWLSFIGAAAFGVLGALGAGAVQ